MRTFLISLLMSVTAIFAGNAHAAVKLNMPAPPNKSAAPVISALQASPIAPQLAPAAPQAQPVPAPAVATDDSLGILALNRYAHARTGSVNQYVRGRSRYPYDDYDYAYYDSYLYGWGFPFGLGCVDICDVRDHCDSDGKGGSNSCPDAAPVHNRK